MTSSSKLHFHRFSSSDPCFKNSFCFWKPTFLAFYIFHTKRYYPDPSFVRKLFIELHYRFVRNTRHTRIQDPSQHDRGNGKLNQQLHAACKNGASALRRYHSPLRFVLRLVLCICVKSMHALQLNYDGVSVCLKFNTEKLLFNSITFP